MIALQPGDEAMTGWLPDLDEILARQLQGGLAAFRAARNVENVRQPARGGADQGFGQSLGRFGREEAAIGKSQLIHLAVNGRGHLRMIVPEARYGRPAASVEITTPLCIDHVRTLAADGHGRRPRHVAMKHVGHVELCSRD